MYGLATIAKMNQLAEKAKELAGPPFEILSECVGGGYRYCRTNPRHPKENRNGLYPLHRVLAENTIGRLLEPGEVVHHRDGNKENNAPENLEVLTNSAHSKEHSKSREVRPQAVICLGCGKLFALKPSILRIRKKWNTNPPSCSHRCSTRVAKNSFVDISAG